MDEQLVLNFRKIEEDGIVRIELSEIPLFIVGRNGLIDTFVEYGDVMEFTTVDDIQDPELKIKFLEWVDILNNFRMERIAEKVIFETTDINPIVKGRNEAIRKAEQAAGLQYEGEAVWVDRAETTPGIIVLSSDRWDLPYIIKNEYENPEIIFLKSKEETGGVRPYYDKPGDGKTYLYVESFSGGGGTQSAPFLVSTIEELQAVQNNLSAHYLQTSNIDASATSSWNGGAGFIPIGEFTSGNTSTSFTGVYDGGNYEVRNLYTNVSSTTRGNGLFASTQGGAIIKNVIIRNAVLDYSGTSGGASGFIVATAQDPTTIENCKVYNSTMHSVGNTGGIAGFFGSGGSKMNNCLVEGCNIYGKGSSKGGLSGYIASCLITNCIVRNTNISGANFTGGLIGDAWSAASTTFPQLQNCHTENVIVRSLSADIGGIVARGGPVNIMKCSFKGSIEFREYYPKESRDVWNTGTTVPQRVGLIVGSAAGAYGGKASLIEDCSASGTIYNNNSSLLANVGYLIGTVAGNTSQGVYANVRRCYGVGGFINRNTNAIITATAIRTSAMTNISDVFASATPLNQPAGDMYKSDSDMQNQATYTNFDFSNIWVMQTYPELRGNTVIFPPDVYPPGNVTDLVAELNEAEVTLTWVEPTDVDYSHMNIYKDGVLLAGEVAKGTTTYTDTGLEVGKTYRYKITTVDLKGNESVGSEVDVSTAPPLPVQIAVWEFSVGAAIVSAMIANPTDPNLKYNKLEIALPNGVIGCFDLLDPTDPDATKFELATPQGIKALRKSV